MQFSSYRFSLLIIAGIVFFLASGCDQLSVKKSLSDDEFSLMNQENQKVIFPDTYLGDVLLIGYVYTHCPDICPAITYNMRDVQRLLDEESGFTLISISFDPDRDTPEILHDYAQNYRLSTDNWSLLTGEKNEVDSLLELLEISTLKTPTRFTDEGNPIYFIDHTDRVTLVDRDGNIRRQYTGSEFDPESVASDIKKLLET